MQPVSFDNDFECQNVVEEFTFEDEGKDCFITVMSLTRTSWVKFESVNSVSEIKRHLELAKQQEFQLAEENCQRKNSFRLSQGTEPNCSVWTCPKIPSYVDIDQHWFLWYFTSKPISVRNEKFFISSEFEKSRWENNSLFLPRISRVPLSQGPWHIDIKNISSSNFAKSSNRREWRAQINSFLWAYLWGNW